MNGQQRTDGARWHQGIITGRSKSSTGQIIFSGNHTKGSEDGKWCTYKDYRILVKFSEFFLYYMVEQSTSCSSLSGQNHK